MWGDGSACVGSRSGRRPSYGGALEEQERTSTLSQSCPPSVAGAVESPPRCHAAGLDSLELSQCTDEEKHTTAQGRRARLHDPIGNPAAMTSASRILRGIVLGYRAIRPLLGGSRCRFWPSCSHYALEALELHGARRGGALAARRILRCHPFHPGGYDPVPAHPSEPSWTAVK